MGENGSGRDRVRVTSISLGRVLVLGVTGEIDQATIGVVRARLLATVAPVPPRGWWWWI